MIKRQVGRVRLTAEGKRTVAMVTGIKCFAAREIPVETAKGRGENGGGGGRGEEWKEEKNVNISSRNVSIILQTVAYQIYSPAADPPFL